jgi:hypothetical protein
MVERSLNIIKKKKKRVSETGTRQGVCFAYDSIWSSGR